ncbi:Bug family tripartite tricarboxylate transporter substrate binding protein [Belnapia rosea]|uniref:Tripartite-type tricarboxylate transporter, receptor component TctC n=1 Tax=Belnapia rosea TaxID=938405 RepID=A0A1G6M544_9PROT|nr:tripartite tricarboxylate transporter substrate binding protein [Belnapia rosea]SDC50619.1 Tripartite-type tricarboxylate transporter, receptor component TctC [Belnapia rosea]
MGLRAGIGRRGVIAAAGGVLAAPALAQAPWPAGQTVAVVIPYAPGGASDVIGRLVTQVLSEKLGGTFVMDHKPGASTSLAARIVARAKPDGMTLLLGTIATFTLTPLALRNPGYDPLADFIHITQVCETLSVLVAHPRWGSFEALMAAAKARPDALSYATWGVGTTAHLPMLDLLGRVGAEMLHVPYNGSPPALTDTIAGRTDCMFALYAACKGHLEEGRVKGLAQPTPERPAAIANVPTFAELGIPDFVYTGWYGVQAPVGTPRAITDRIERALTEGLADPRIQAFMATQGIAPSAMGNAAAVARIERELPSNRRLMQRAGLNPE